MKKQTWTIKKQSCGAWGVRDDRCVLSAEYCCGEDLVEWLDVQRVGRMPGHPCNGLRDEVSVFVDTTCNAGSMGGDVVERLASEDTGRLCFRG